ncbi:uncharacterized protein LOC114349488 isoform X4 [Diabrotica virgifera virgifera]|uniref:Uncharacterized protein LOC114349488 isoform X4 n=1 Tax=Diabrotica virgifera virgifera TaxID=50390 RepID=A0A6P7H109_DIAVI|nr:uncharacterized protein LOC114349488 isoform X4 [Diabrotica virgifera virgifera]
MQPIQVYQFLVLILTLTVTSGMQLEGHCVKVFYKQNNYYNIKCFKLENDFLTIRTDQNDTIQLKESDEIDNCYTLLRNGKDENVTCLDISTINCVRPGEPSWTNAKRESRQVSCTRQESESQFYSLAHKDLVILIKEVGPHRLLIHIPNLRPPRE